MYPGDLLPVEKNAVAAHSDTETPRHLRHLRLLSHTASRLLAGEDPDELLPELFPVLAAEFGVDIAFGHSLRDADGSMGLMFERSDRDAASVSADLIETSAMVTECAAATRGPVRIMDIQSEDTPCDPRLKATGIHSLVCEPLLAGDRVLGTLCFASCRGGIFDEEAVLFFEAIAQHAALARQRVEMTSALVASEARLRLAQDAAGTATWDLDVDTGRVRLSREGFEMFGLPAERLGEFGEADWLALIHPDDRDTVQSAVGRAVESRGLFDIVFRSAGSRRGQRWIQGLGRVTPDAHGRTRRMIGLSFDVTAQRKQEAQLAETKERLALALEGTQEGLWDWNTVTGEVWFSDRWHTMLGYELGEVEPHVRSWERLVHPDDLADVMRVLQDHLDGRTPYYETEHRVLMKDGRWLWVLDRGKVVSRDLEGRALRAVGTHADVSRRKTAEAELQRSQALVAGLLEHAPAAIFAHDRAGRYQLLNRGWEQVSGKDRDLALGQLLRAVWPPEVAESFAADETAVFEEGRKVETEEWVETAGGRRLFHSVKFPLVHDGAVQSLCGISIDITARTEAEARLRESENRYRTLTEASPGIVWTAEPDGRVTYVNSRWEELTGEKLTSPAPEVTHRIHPDDLPVERKQLRKALAARSAYESEWRLRLKDGSWRWYQSNALPMLDDSGRVSQWIGVATSIDAQKNTEAALKQALADKDVLVREIDHRVKNSLAMASAMLGAQERATTSPEARNALAEAAGRLMMIARVHEQLYQSSDVSSIEIKRYLGSICKDLQGSLARAGDIDLTIEVDPLHIPVDRAVSLGLIVVELLTNAAKYATRADDRLRIELSCRQVGDRLRLDLQDNGPGLPAGFKISSSQGHGTRIVAMLVRRLGGSVEASSRPDGARFTVDVPLRRGKTLNSMIAGVAGNA